MADIFPKITDVENLKNISAMLALPLLCVAYTLQTGAEISLSEDFVFDIPEDMATKFKINRLIFIFILKSAWVCFCAFFVYQIVMEFYCEIKYPIMIYFSIFLLSIGLLGIFGRNEIKTLNEINSFWFYCAIVWSLYFRGLHEKIFGADERI